MKMATDICTYILQVPIQQKMVDTSLLTTDEVSHHASPFLQYSLYNLSLQLAWLNGYHGTCQTVIGQYLMDTGKSQVAQWLKTQTERF